jgi:hypothetical protein
MWRFSGSGGIDYGKVWKRTSRKEDNGVYELWAETVF